MFWPQVLPWRSRQHLSTTRAYSSLAPFLPGGDTRRQGRAREEQGHLWEVLASARGMGSCGWENPAGPSLPLKSRSSADLAFFLLFSLSLALRCALRF